MSQQQEEEQQPQQTPPAQLLIQTPPLQKDTILTTKLTPPSPSLGFRVQEYEPASAATAATSSPKTPTRGVHNFDPFAGYEPPGGEQEEESVGDLSSGLVDEFTRVSGRRGLHSWPSHALVVCSRFYHIDVAATAGCCWH